MKKKRNGQKNKEKTPTVFPLDPSGLPRFLLCWFARLPSPHIVLGTYVRSRRGCGNLDSNWATLFPTGHGPRVLRTLPHPVQVIKEFPSRARCIVVPKARRQLGRREHTDGHQGSMGHVSHMRSPVSIRHVLFNWAELWHLQAESLMLKHSPFETQFTPVHVSHALVSREQASTRTLAVTHPLAQPLYGDFCQARRFEWLHHLSVITWPAALDPPVQRQQLAGPAAPDLPVEHVSYTEVEAALAASHSRAS